jgi:hypothetical protein
VGVRLSDSDETVHPVGAASNWNESRYLDFLDLDQRIGGWFRIASRPNEGRGEMSACLHLPNGKTAFMFSRPPVSSNELELGGQAWDVQQPWRLTRVRYSGEMLILDDPWVLTDPKAAFAENSRVDVEADLTCRGQGLGSVMGADQDHIELILLPGQADFHYQHLVETSGTVKVGDSTWRTTGRGGKDHSWGPRNWHAKVLFRWLIASLDDDNGFMLVRGVGPTKQTRSGFWWHDGGFCLLDTFEMSNRYGGPPHYELREVSVTARAGRQVLHAKGVPQGWVPLRHRQPGPDGRQATLRIVKSPIEWDYSGRSAPGMCEYHDLIQDGRPASLGE